MPSESFETIFRRDLDRLPGLADEDLVPRGADSARRVSFGSVLALVGVFVAVVVVVLNLQAIRDADRSPQEAAATQSPYFVIAGGAAAGATASPNPAAAPSPAATWIVGPPVSNPLLGVPSCPPGSSPILDVTHWPPPGDLPGGGAPTAEEAFRRAYPTVTDFKMFPWGTSPAPVWVVAGSETYVVNYSGGPGLNSWFAHPAKYVGCYTPEPRTPRPSGLPSEAPTTFG